MAYIMTDKKRYQMTEDERAEREKIKTVHKKLREPLRGGSGDRHDILAWAFARGFKFRRCERNHRTQIVNGELYEHNMPSSTALWSALHKAGVFVKPFLPEGQDIKAIEAWFADPAGAIAAPLPKPKKPYSPVVAA